MMTDTLNAINLATLNTQLRNAPIGHAVYYSEQTTSTMREAHERVAAARATDPAGLGPAISGTIFVTEEQTAGRGRLQRTWETPFGTALLVSILLCEPHLSQYPHLRQRPQLLPMLSGAAAVKTLAALTIDDATDERLADQVALKWPNDLLLSLGPGAPQPSWGKVAGILLESSFRNNLLDYVVIGIGINVNQQQTQFPPAVPGSPPPASLRTRLGRNLDRTELLVSLCRNVGTLLAQPAHEVYAAWRAHLHTLGQAVTVRAGVGSAEGSNTAAGASGDANAPFEGVAVDVTPDGDLVVEATQNGRKERRQFSAGAVTLRSG